MARQVTVTRKLAEAAGEVGEHYAGHADRPLGGYLETTTFYSSVVGVLASAAALTGREVPAYGMSGRDVVLAAAATHKLRRLLTRDPVTKPQRAPFIFLPRTTRLAMGTFAALAGADMAQFAHSWLTKSAS
jgi:hypothetical protein